MKVRVDGRMYRAHRLVFMYHHGYMPNIVDHIDCDKTNNRIENLREASKSENGMNRAGSYSGTGFRNVYKRGDAYQVHMRRKGKIHYVGTFGSIKDAIAAAEDARRKLFGEFA